MTDSMYIEQIYKRMDKAVLDNLFGPTHQSCNSDIIDDIYKCLDKLTILIFCNIDDYDTIKEFLDNQEGYYEVIKTPYLENGKVIFVEDEKIKIDILSGRRRFKKLKKELCDECEKHGIKLKQKDI